MARDYRVALLLVTLFSSQAIALPAHPVPGAETPTLDGTSALTPSFPDKVAAVDFPASPLPPTGSAVASTIAPAGLDAAIPANPVSPPIPNGSATAPVTDGTGPSSNPPAKPQGSGGKAQDSPIVDGKGPVKPSSSADSANPPPGGPLPPSNLDTGAVAAGSSCKPDGQVNCVCGNTYQTCASGVWTATQPVAAGTMCTAGISANLDIKAISATGGVGPQRPGCGSGAASSVPPPPTPDTSSSASIAPVSPPAPDAAGPTTPSPSASAAAIKTPIGSDAISSDPTTLGGSGAIPSGSQKADPTKSKGDKENGGAASIGGASVNPAPAKVQPISRSPHFQSSYSLRSDPPSQPFDVDDSKPTSYPHAFVEGYGGNLDNEDDDDVEDKDESFDQEDDEDDDFTSPPQYQKETSDDEVPMPKLQHPPIIIINNISPTPTNGNGLRDPPKMAGSSAPSFSSILSDAGRKVNDNTNLNQESKTSSSTSSSATSSTTSTGVGSAGTNQPIPASNAFAAALNATSNSTLNATPKDSSASSLSGSASQSSDADEDSESDDSTSTSSSSASGPTSTAAPSSQTSSADSSAPTPPGSSASSDSTTPSTDDSESSSQKSSPDAESIVAEAGSSTTPTDAPATLKNRAVNSSAASVELIKSAGLGLVALTLVVAMSW